MTPGERFDQDEVLRFGDPWHGLYRNGVVELPNATTRAPGGAPSNGSSFVIQIPGRPAVTTSPADAAQGMTWLNYAIMAGDAHAVYGRSLGDNSWIFIDADGVPWRAVMSWAAMTTSLLTVTLHRFGLLNTPPDEVTYSVSAAFAPSAVTEDYTTRLDVDDVDSHGRQAALVYWHFNPYGDGRRRVEKIYLLSLSGSGAGFSLALVDHTPAPLVATSSGTFSDHDGRSIWVRDNGADVSGPYVPDQFGYPSGFVPVYGHWYQLSYGWALHDHYWNTEVYVVGATLIDDSFALVLGTTYTETDAVTTVDMDTLWDHYLPDMVNPTLSPAMYQVTDTTGTFIITLNGIDTEVAFECHSERWQFPPFGPTDSGYQSVDGYYWGDGYTQVFHPTSPAVIGGHAEPAPYSAGLPWYWMGAPTALPFFRVTNRVFGMAVGGARLCVCGPANSVKSESFATDSGIAYATAHPISGQMVVSPTPVCWV